MMIVPWLCLVEDIAGSVDSAVAVSGPPSPAETTPPPASIVKQSSVSFDKTIGRKDSGKPNIRINVYRHIP